MKFEEDQDWVDNLEYEFTTLDGLLAEIAYAYEPTYPIRRDKEGFFYIYKLIIGSNWCQYKDQYYRLVPGLYAQLVRFFEIEYVE